VFVFVVHCVSKNDIDVAHYDFPDMTYNVFGRTLNPAQSNRTLTDFGIFWQGHC